MNKIFQIGLASAAIVAAMPAQATEFVVDTTTYGKTNTTGLGNVFTYELAKGSEKLTVQASGWNLNNSTGNWIVNTSKIVSFGTAGLGVESRNETQTQLDQGHHQVDNNNGFEYIMLRFSEAVSLASIGINSYGMTGIGTDNDLGVFTSKATSFTDGMLWSSIGVQNYTASNGTGASGPRPFDLASVKSNVWMISSSLQDTARNDAFKLTTLRVVTAVPEPATWAMMLVGFGMVAGAARYRRRKTITAFA